MSTEFKILSIDGGGIRGILPCSVLKFIEDQTKYPISSLFNLIAGTSTGGIIAMGLSIQKNGPVFTAADMLNLYIKHGEKIFSDRDTALFNWINKALLSKPYNSEHLESILETYFNETRLKDCFPDLLITTYEIEKGLPFIFSSRLAKQSSGEDFPLKEISRSTTAAPTYFKPSTITDQNGEEYVFVDGGVFANNPSILAYAEAKELWNNSKKQPTSYPIKSGTVKSFTPVIESTNDDLPFYMLSLGTGQAPNTLLKSQIEGKRSWRWIKPLLKDVFMRGATENTNFVMQHLLPPFKNGTSRYVRINFPIPVIYSEMDDASEENINKLLEISEKYIKANETELLNICEILAG